MHIQLSKAMVAVAISSALYLGAAWGQTQQQPQPAQQAKPQKQWKDRQEYDLFEAIDKTTDPKKKLELLDQWRDKYPGSDFKIERLARYLDAYKSLNDAAKMYDTAKEMMTVTDDANVPARLQGLYWLNVLVPTSSAPDRLEVGEKAGNALLSLSNEFFTPANKPAKVTEGDWQKNKSVMDVAAHRTLGWVALQQKNYEAAEKQLTSELKLNPADGEAFYWLGTAILAQKKPERQSEALYYIARAAAYDGTGAIEPARRRQLEAYIEKAYTTYHGKDPQGLQQLLQQAKANPFPPEGFHLPSEAEVAAQKESQLAATNPSLAFWMKLKNALEAPDGQQYFESGMKGALIPPEGQPPLRGTVISQEGARAAKSVVLGISNPSTPEVRLNFETPIPGRAEPGTMIEFRGVATSFTKEPFVVTFDAEKQYISGWPAPAPARKAPVRKKPKKG